MKLLIATAILGIFVKYSNQQCLIATDGRPQQKSVSLYSGQREFAMRMLQAINEQNPTDNVFFSPFSTYHALLLAYFISAHDTERSLTSALNIDPTLDKLDMQRAYKTHRLVRNGRDSSYEFTSANKIYVTDQVQIRDCMFDFFQDELEVKNFASDPEKIRNEINRFVENTTKNMIKDLLPPGAIGGDTNLVLLNAAYFKGLWASKFNPDSTTKDLFYTSGDEKKFVSMMHQKGTFNYHVSESLRVQILELPYKGNDISMFILLPPFRNGLNDLLMALKNQTVLLSLINNSMMEEREVMVSLPRFSMETSVELLPVLQSTGFGSLFERDADFSLLTEQQTRDFNFHNGIHKAKIEVNEKGTVAAAATALISDRIFSLPVTFTCNQPFIFLITSNVPKPGVILFAGIYKHPSEQPEQQQQNVLKSLGAGALFDESADLRGLLESGNLTLGDALHKARIEVSEDGTKAAAATVLFTFRSSRPLEPAHFNCNHPFVYIIYHRTDNVILFTGVYRKP